MRKITLLFILLFSSSALFAQLGVGTLTPDSSSVIDMSTTDKGLLIPRLTQTQRNSINAPAHSLMMFCVDCSPVGIYYYDTNTTAWTVLDTDTQLDESAVDAFVANNGYLTSFTEVDGSTTNEIQTLSRSGLTLTLNNGGGSVTDSVLTENDVDAMVANNGYLTSFTEVDGSTTNEIQTLSRSGLTLTLNNGGGSITDSVLTENDVDAMVSNNGYLTSFTEVDGSTTNEIQTLSRSGLTLTLDNGGGSVTDSVLTETDVDAMVANNGYLTSFTEVDGSTTNEIQDLNLNSNTLSIENGNSVDLSSYLDNTDDQAISRDGLTVTLENGGTFQDSVLTETDVDAMVANNNYLTSFTEVDGSTTNEIQDLNLNSNTLSIENGNGVDLSSYLDNTDDQAISRDGLTVTLEDGGSFQDSVLTETDVDAMVANNGYLTSFTEVDGSTTNEIQTLSRSGLTLTLNNGGGSVTDSVLTETDVDAMVANNNYLTSFTEMDGSTTNEIQDLNLNSNTLSIENGNSVDLSSYLDNTDNQAISRDGLTVNLENGGSFQDSVLTETDVDAMVANNGYLTSQTDDQTISRDGLTVTLENGGTFQDSVLTETDVDAMVADNGFAVGQIWDRTNNVISPGSDANYVNDDFVFGSNELDADGKDENHRNRMIFDKSKGFFAAGRSTDQWADSLRGEYSASFGMLNEAEGDASFAAGERNKVSGNYGAVFGYSNYASNSHGYAFGSQNNILGSFVFTNGVGNYMPYDHGVAMGTGLENSSSHEYIFGYFNEKYTAANNDQDHLFVIGNGTSFVDRSNAVTVLKGGEMGVGTSTPTHTLDVSGEGRFTDSLTIGAYTLPPSDGTANQVLSTDGNGEVSWATDGDASSSNEIQDLDLSNDILSIDGANSVNLSPYLDNTDDQQLSRDGLIVTLENGGTFQDSVLTETDVDAMVANNNYLTSFTEVDGSTTNEIQTLSRSGLTLTLNNGGGSVTDSVLTEIDVDAMVANNNYLTSFTELDGSTTNEIQDLDLNSNTLSIENGNSVDLSSYLDNTDDQAISRDGLTVTLENGGSFQDSVDNLGNHIASQNIELNGNWIGNDGGDEGIRVADNGRVAVGVDSAHTMLHVEGRNITVNGQPNVVALFGSTDGSGYDGRIELRSTRESIASSDGGVILSNYDANNGTTHVAGDLAIYGQDNTNNLGGVRLRTSADGSTLTNGLIVDKDQNVEIPNGSLTVGPYTLPTTDGEENEVLVTDGSGNISWADAASAYSKVWNFNFIPNDRDSLHENYIGTFNCSSGPVVVEIADGGPSFGASGQYTITRDFGSTPIVALHQDGLVGDGYAFYYRIISGCQYELFFDPENGGTSSIAFIVNVRVGGFMSETISSNTSSNILECNYGITSDFRGRVGIGVKNPIEEFEVNGDGAVSGTFKVGAYTLPSTDGTSDQVLKTNGSGTLSWSNDETTDNLGDHIATQNIELNGNWLSSDGSDEGLSVQNNGFVGVGTDSAHTPFHVSTNTTQNDISNVYALFGKTSGSGTQDGKIELRSIRTGVSNSEGGVVLTNYDLNIDSTHVMGDMAVWGTNNTTNRGGIRFRTSANGSYAGMTNALTIDENQNVNIPNGNFSIGGNLSLNGGWLSNDGDDEGLFINNAGNVGIGNFGDQNIPIEGPLQIAQVSNTVGNLTNVLAVFGDSWEDVPFSNSTVEIRGKMDDISTGVGASITLTNYDNDNATTNIMGDLATFGQDGNQNQGGLQLRTSSDGTSLTAALQIDKDQNVSIANGYVGIGTSNPLAGLHVTANEDGLNGVPHVAALFGNEVDGIESTHIEIKGSSTNNLQSLTGLVISNYSNTLGETKIMGHLGTFGEGSNGLGGLRLRTSFDGTYANLTNALTIDKSQNVSIPNGNLTVNDYTLPASDGNDGEVLVTDGNGNTSWENAGVPIGSIQMWATATPPTGWLICNGSSFNASTYPELQTVLGTNSTPNLSGRMPLGVGQSNEPTATNHSLGSVGGEETVTLTVAQMPAHSHDIRYREGEESGGGNDYSDLGDSGTTDSTESEGGNQAHENMPPFYTLYFIIKAE